MKKLKTPKEVFEYLSDIYSKCKTTEDSYKNGIDKFICCSINYLLKKDIINIDLHKESKSILMKNKPTHDHWATKSEDWTGWDAWWDIYGNNIEQVFQDKSKFLKELAESLNK